MIAWDPIVVVAGKHRLIIHRKTTAKLSLHGPHLIGIIEEVGYEVLVGVIKKWILIAAVGKQAIGRVEGERACVCVLQLVDLTNTH